MTPLRLATRKSPLALAQSQWVAHRIEDAVGVPVELVPVVSQGDRSSRPLTAMGGVGVFVAAVRDAVLAGEADVAVHSLKDLPTALHPGLALAAVPERGDVRDALVSRAASLDELAPGSRVGTGSPRRSAQLRDLRPDLEVVPIRGNVETRLGFVDSGELDAVLLALAGLQRLGLADRATDVLPADRMMPAPGQGALAVETRTGDTAARAAVAVLDDLPTRAAVSAERALLARLEAGCTAPVGALATVVADQIFLTGVVHAAEDSRAIRVSVSGPAGAPTDLGRAAAERLLADEGLVGGVVR